MPQQGPGAVIRPMPSVKSGCLPCHVPQASERPFQAPGVKGVPRPPPRRCWTPEYLGFWSHAPLPSSWSQADWLIWSQLDGVPWETGMERRGGRVVKTPPPPPPATQSRGSRREGGAGWREQSEETLWVRRG